MLRPHFCSLEPRTVRPWRCFVCLIFLGCSGLSTQAYVLSCLTTNRQLEVSELLVFWEGVGASFCWTCLRESRVEYSGEARWLLGEVGAWWGGACGMAVQGVGGCEGVGKEGEEGACLARLQQLAREQSSSRILSACSEFRFALHWHYCYWRPRVLEAFWLCWALLLQL